MAKGSKVGAIDRHIGARIRARRLALGIRQKTLAIDIGVTMQQLQKYESGINRVSASKLFEIAALLSVSVAAFFDGMPTGASGRKATDASSAFERMIETEEGLALVGLFPRLVVANRRRAVVEIVRAMIGGE
ncbi:MAG TPA: helix-turn-helix transcriptional regulator [Rhizomicrobium sp.]